jgi:hypothetical protein
MNHPNFEAELRRVITGDDAKGRSTVILDGGPAEDAAQRLFEIWTDSLTGALDPRTHADLGKGQVVLSPPDGGVKVRWFVVEPLPEGVAKASLDAGARAGFAAVGAEHHLIDQSRHPYMHETPTLDVICLLKGDVTLILDDGEVRLTPGQVVIQRATNHAWEAHGGPALLLAVLIDRPIAG